MVQRDDTLTIENEYIQLSFSKKDGALLSVRNQKSGIELLSVQGYQGLWELGALTEDFRHITLSGVQRSRPYFESIQFKQNISHIILNIIWGKIWLDQLPGEYPLRLNITVIVDESPFTKWFIDAENNGKLGIEFISVPLLSGVGYLGNSGQDDYLAVPIYEGRLYRNPLDLIAPGFNQHYPTAWFNMQFMALYDQATNTGFYLATYDTQGNLKNFAWNNYGKFGVLAITHYPEVSFGGSYRSLYPTVLGVFEGDWYDAAEIYRQWATKQWWAQEKIWQKAPKWLLRTPLSKDFCSYYSPSLTPNPLDRFNRTYQEALIKFDQQRRLIDLDSLVFFWGWERRGAWTSGEFFPPSEGWESFNNLLNQSSLLGFTLYLPIGSSAGEIWEDSILVNSTTIMKYAALNERGLVIKGRKTIMFDPSTSFWKDYIKSTVLELVRRGVKAIQLDGIPHCGPPYIKCYNTLHGHPPGYGGSWWVESWINILNETLTEARKINPDVVFGGEGSSEVFLPFLYIFHSRENWEGLIDPYVMMGYGSLIPLFQYVYHDYVITLGEINPAFGVARNYETSLLYIAHTLTHGEVASYNLQIDLDSLDSGIYPESSWKNPFKFLLKSALARIYAYDYLVKGRLIKGPAIKSPEYTVTGFEFHNLTVFTQSVLHSSFLSDNIIAVVLANIRSDPIMVEVTLDREILKYIGSDKVALLLLWESGYQVLTQTLSIPATIRMTLPGQSIHVLKILQPDMLEDHIEHHKAYLLAFYYGGIRQQLRSMGISGDFHSLIIMAREKFYNKESKESAQLSITAFISMLKSLERFKSLVGQNKTSEEDQKTMEFIKSEKNFEAGLAAYEVITRFLDFIRPRVLLDGTHSDRAGPWDFLIQLLSNLGMIAELNEDSLLSKALSEYNIVVLSEPIKPLDWSELESLLNFVRNGGGLFIILDANVGTSINKLLNIFNITIYDGAVKAQKYEWDEGSFKLDQVRKHEITIGIYERQHIWPLLVNWMAPMKSNNSMSIILTDNLTWGTTMTVQGPFTYLAATDYGLGRIVALADNPYKDSMVLWSQHQELLLNIFRYLVKRTLWDNTLLIVQASTNRTRVDVGSEVVIKFVVIRASDGKPASNTYLYINDIGTRTDLEGIALIHYTSYCSEKILFKPSYGSVESKSFRILNATTLPEVIWDKVIISLAPMEIRVKRGENFTINVDARYAYDFTPFKGSVILNETLPIDKPGEYCIGALYIVDNMFGLTVFDSNQVKIIIEESPIVTTTLGANLIIPLMLGGIFVFLLLIIFIKMKSTLKPTRMIKKQAEMASCLWKFLKFL
ncbi:MAG: DUF6259 domain-containing protein [Candidatus Bathyarchaeia archaeon]